jgi:ABC-type antimicrobial peptide transport system permease subunit
MATTTPAVARPDHAGSTALRTGAGLMTLAAAGFIVYAALFFARNFSDSFLELGIGPGEVDVGRQQIQSFSPSLLHYVGHLHLAVAGFVAATGLAVAFLSWFGVRQGHLWAWVGAVAAPVLGLAVALPHLTDQRTIVSYPAAALALGISALVGIVAGLGPANQAAALDPATALRHE